MENLPPEILLVIFAKLDRNSLLSAIRVSQAWQKILSPILWQDIELGVYVSKAFGEGVRRNGSFIRKLMVYSYESLGPFLQEEEEKVQGQGAEEEETVQGRLERRPYVTGLVELSFRARMPTDLPLRAPPLPHPGGHFNWFKKWEPRLLMMMRNNPQLAILDSRWWPVTAEWYYKRQLLSPVDQGLGQALRVLKILVDLPHNDRSHPLFWLFRNLPQTLEELVMEIQSGKSLQHRNHEEEEEFRGCQKRSLTASQAQDELERYDNERDRRMDLGEDTEPTKPIPPIPLKSLQLYGSYPMPLPGLDGCSIGSTFEVQGGHAQVTRPAYFLQELEQLIRQCRPTLESLTMGMRPRGCLFVTGEHPTEWFELRKLAEILDRTQDANSGPGSVLDFTTYQEWTDEDLAYLLHPSSSPDYKNGSQSTSTPPDPSYHPSGWRNLVLVDTQTSFTKTSAAMLEHVSTLESLILEESKGMALGASKGFPSLDLARIFRTSPRLRCLKTIENDELPIFQDGDPYLNIFMDAQDLLQPLDEIDQFWSTWKNRNNVHPQNRGWVPPYDRGHRQQSWHGDQNVWACHETLEILHIMIKNVPRPDLARSQFGGRLGRHRNGTLAHEEYKNPQVAVQVEQEICRRLGRMTRLKELVLGVDDRRWNELMSYREIPKNRLLALGIDWDLRKVMQERMQREADEAMNEDDASYHDDHDEEEEDGQDVHMDGLEISSVDQGDEAIDGAMEIVLEEVHDFVLEEVHEIILEDQEAGQGVIIEEIQEDDQGDVQDVVQQQIQGGEVQEEIHEDIQQDGHEEGQEEGQQVGENNDGDDGDYSDSDEQVWEWEEDWPPEIPLMYHDEGFQYSCLSLSLGAGLEHLASLKDLEVLSIERMSHRVRLPEVQWMVAHWPKLRRIDGLAHMRDPRCKTPGETEEAVEWLQEHYPWIKLGWSPDNMRQGSWTRTDYTKIWD
ncbi:hypothetical protein EMPS_04659 [Entomortierella parvispora]|uniref:F-box domain-containing protein n=1 Tax=Entomortierella parvispora TaxID=205924 RepID=A0A9P3H9M8_9FUNG|nr:hypothetical protein EMPS_04659 [Entomortierella parvispora]